MSSHHIIRDNQEPAVFIADWPEGMSEDLLGQILEWSPTVIARDTCVEQLESRRIKVDVLIRPLNAPVQEPRQADLEVISYSEDYLSELFHYLKSARNFAVYLIGSFARTSLLPYAHQFTIIWLHQTYKTVLVKHYSKWLPEQTCLTVNQELEGTLRNLAVIRRGVYRVEKDGLVTIPEQPNYIFLTEQL